MQILTIVKKEVIQGLRDLKSMILMIIMPTVLTLILGVALNNNEMKTIDFSKVNVIYSCNNNDMECKKIANGYITMLEKLKINCREDSIDKYNNNTVIIDFKDLNNIKVNYSYKIKSEGEYISYFIKKFTEKNKMINILSQNDKLVKYENEEYKVVTLKPLQGESANTSLNYYGITMVVITVMFASVSGAYKIIKERQNGTLMKIRTVSISTLKLLSGKVIGSLIIVLIQLTVTLFVSKYVIKVNWGENLRFIILLLLCEGIFAISIGVFIGYIVKDNKSAWILLLSIIMVLGFFSGSFLPLDKSNIKLISTIANMNLLKYENNAIFNIIYRNNIILSINLSIIFLIVSISLIVITSQIMEEGV